MPVVTVLARDIDGQADVSQAWATLWTLPCAGAHGHGPPETVCITRRASVWPGTSGASCALFCRKNVVPGMIQ